MTDEDLIRVFNYIWFFKGVLRWTRGPGKRKTHYLQFLAHMQFEGEKGAKNVKSRIADKKWDKKEFLEVFMIVHNTI